MAHAKRLPGAGPGAPLCIVGLGASAGGLAALQRVLSAARPSAGLAFVVVQHLDPASESRLSSILSRATDLTVQDVRDGQPVEGANVYVLPPGKDLTLQEGRLRLHDRTQRLPHPIDRFFSSLAQDQQERAVAVVLTGTGNDGAAGVREVKKHGGFVVAQDPQAAEHDAMPRSAIATGAVDLVLPPEEIAARLERFAQASAVGEAEEPGLDEVVAVLRRHDARPDFRAYRRGTLARRLQRRVALVGDASLKDYVRRLDRDPDERVRLRRDLLIGVTGFLREPDAFQELAETVVPRLFAHGGPVRVWVAGCSTGEEAYALAMLLLEHRSRLGTDAPIQVFATDINEEAVAAARAGLFTPEALAGLDDARRDRFFVRDAGGHRVTRELRQTIAFAVHDLLSDPPFARLDLVSCRNLLIYLRPDAQQRVLETLHLALRPGGYLFLGRSETANRAEGAFTAVGNKGIYRRSDTAKPVLRAPQRPTDVPLPARRAPVPDAKEVAREWLLRRFTPTALAVDENGQIVYLHGDLEPYLALPQGQPRLDLLAMARDGLRARLRSAIHQARRDDQDVLLTDVQVAHDGAVRRADVRIQRVPSREGPHLLLVTFHERAETDSEGTHAVAEPMDERLLAELEDELRTTKAQLADSMAAAEASNEELRAHGEEMASTNEELRTTLEELGTSKEELETLNQELVAANAQLARTAEEATSLANDLENLYSSTGIPVLFLDEALHIRRATPAAARLFVQLATETGRPLAEAARRFDDPALVPDALRVLHDLAPIEREILGDDGTRYLRRILPYRTSDHRIAGVVLTFQDIEDLKRTEDGLRAAQVFAESIVAAVPTPLLVLDDDLRLRVTNRAFRTQFGRGPEPVGLRLAEVMGPQWDVPDLRDLARGARPVLPPIESEQATEGGPRTLRMQAYAMPPANGRRSVLVSFQDVTEHRESERAHAVFTGRLQRHAEKSAAAVLEKGRLLDNVSYMIGHDLKEPVRTMEGLLTRLEESRDETLPPESRALLSQLRDQTRRLSSLVQGLLAFSRTSSTDLDHTYPVGVRAALASEDCTSRFQKLLRDRGARLVVTGEDGPVLANFPAMGYVFGNLIQNALRHNQAPAPQVHVETAAPRDGLVHIVVRDNGPGFPADVIAGLQDMQAATRGFGLAIAKRTAEALGGQMWLENTPTGGAAHVLLPAAPADGAAADGTGA